MTLLKRIFKKPIIWIALALLAVFIFLYIKGFRITYAPNLKNDWDAISGSAAWASVLLSFAAICAAIYVPYKVANEQNRISLFEKRFDALKKINILAFVYTKIEETMSELIVPEKSRKDFIFSIHDCNKLFSIIKENTDEMYHYLFEAGICDKIKFIHSSGIELEEKLSNFEKLIRTQHYVSISDKQWYSMISKDEEIIDYQKEILNICRSVITLRKDIIKEVEDCMNLRKL